MKRIEGVGRLALLGGGEFSFGETREADLRWLELAPPGPIGFVPTASGSTEYGHHFADYLQELAGREVVVVPVFRRRDACRGKNVARIDDVGTIYLGGGVTDHLLDTLKETPALEALERKLVGGGLIVAIAAAAQATGSVAHSLLRREACPGFGWLPGGAVEPNFQLSQDRRLRELLATPGASWGLGLPAGAMVVFGPGEDVEAVGPAYRLDAAGSEPLALP